MKFITTEECFGTCFLNMWALPKRFLFFIIISVDTHFWEDWRLDGKISVS